MHVKNFNTILSFFLFSNFLLQFKSKDREKTARFLLIHPGSAKTHPKSLTKNTFSSSLWRSVRIIIGFKLFTKASLRKLHKYLSWRSQFGIKNRTKRDCVTWDALLLQLFAIAIKLSSRKKKEICVEIFGWLFFELFFYFFLFHLFSCFASSQCNKKPQRIENCKNREGRACITNDRLLQSWW